MYDEYSSYCAVFPFAKKCVLDSVTDIHLILPLEVLDEVPVSLFVGVGLIVNVVLIYRVVKHTCPEYRSAHYCMSVLLRNAYFDGAWQERGAILLPLLPPDLGYISFRSTYILPNEGRSRTQTRILVSLYIIE